MAIDKVGGRLPIILKNDATGKAKGTKDDQTRDVKDKVQLSDEAKVLYGAEKAKKIDAIRANMKNGFYETPEVTEKVVEGLLRDLKKHSQA